MMVDKNVILCVDDEVNILKSLERVLKAPDCRVFSASTPQQGLDILEKEEVDLVIVDQRMPTMTGSEFIRRVKEKYPRISRLMLSGFSDFDSLVKAVNEGEIFRFIAKPWKNDELKEIVRMALEHKRIQLTIESLFKNMNQIAHLSDHVSIEPLQEQNSILVRVPDSGKVNSQDALA